MTKDKLIVHYLAGQPQEVRDLFYALEHPKFEVSAGTVLREASSFIRRKAKEGDLIFFELLGKALE